jgi:hypothetical protein
LSLADDIFAEWDQDKSPTEPAPVFGRKLSVIRMGVKAREMYEFDTFKVEDKKAEMRRGYMRTILLIYTLVDQDRSPVFSMAQLERVARLDSVEVEKAYKLAMELNGLNVDAVDNAKKNSTPSPDSGSGSGSPSASAEPSTS